MRDTGKRLWFLCDPLSDTPNRPLEEHRQVYFNTLVASLMFPEATGYEVLPWPERIFWNVPAEYATVILSATRACEAIAQVDRRVAFTTRRGRRGHRAAVQRLDDGGARRARSRAC
jgi:hypothetical protein